MARTFIIEKELKNTNKQKLNMKSIKIHEEIITPQKVKTTTNQAKYISPKQKKFIIKKLIRGENRKDKMFKGVKINLNIAKDLFK